MNITIYHYTKYFLNIDIRKLYFFNAVGKPKYVTHVGIEYKQNSGQSMKLGIFKTGPSFLG
jgi:hypothetical protein